MFKRTISITLILFLMYSVFVVFLAPKWWTASQHQWQANTIQAQKYIYNERKDTIDNLIIGSSLSGRLIMDSLPRTYNLSFDGQSIFDGLNILTRVEEDMLPKNIFVETNFVLRGEDKKFTQSLNSILYYPKKAIISLREDKQPVAVMGMQLSRLTGKVFSLIKSPFFQFLPSSKSQTDNLFLKLLSLQVKAYNYLPPEPSLNESFMNLKNYIAELESKKVNVVFFEMPVNSQLTFLPQANLIRQTFHKHFSPENYGYISIPDSLVFTTTDGLHLNSDEALEYTSYFKNQITYYSR